VVPAALDPAIRRSLVLETWFVLIAFLLPTVSAALVVLVQGVTRVGSITRFPDLVHNPVANMVLGILTYLPVAAVVPLAILLLARTGQPPATIGLGRPRLRLDVVPGLGLAAASFGTELLLAVALAPLLDHVKKVVVAVPTGHVPAYYVIWGLCVAFTTAVAEEVVVNGYLITRLAQLGWSPKRALTLSIVLRTSYHVYYGLGFLFTIPFGLFVTTSFQKHRRLNRAIAAHFIYDAVLITISVLSASVVVRLV
jgi:membrane protease YdiL (CAAX protease family)